MSDTMISFRDNSLSTNFLTEDDIRKTCPFAFKTTPTNPSVSDKYVQATTIDVVNDMEKLGWKPVLAKQCRGKKNSKGIRSFHMIALQNPNVKVLDTNGNIEGYPRIILTNSHDGFNSFKFMCGFYKIICSNGLVIADEEFSKLSIRHINYNFEELVKTVRNITENLPNFVSSVNNMKNTILNENEKYELAKTFYIIKKDISDKEKIDSKTIFEILKPNREEDNFNDLWSIYNTCQENIIKGNFYAINKKNKLTKQRAVKSFKKDIEYNAKFWEIANQYVKIAS